MSGTRKNDPVDYGDVKITKLPPGKAYGADDLTRWSHNRSVGCSGVSSVNTKTVTFRCKKCHGETQVSISKIMKKKPRFKCRHCGKGGWPKVIKVDVAMP